MQQSAEQDRQERRAQERATQQMMLTLGASLGSLAAAWASGNTKASAVFRPGEQPVLEGVQEQEEQVLEDELEEGVYDLVELKGDDEVSSDEEVDKENKENKESPPKRLRRSRKKKQPNQNK
jgi:hypothetical protein